MREQLSFQLIKLELSLSLNFESPKKGICINCLSVRLDISVTISDVLFESTLDSKAKEFNCIRNLNTFRYYD